MSTVNATMRHKARRLALQALYQWQLSGSELTAIEAQFHTYNNMEKVDLSFFNELLHQIPHHLSEIDSQFTPFLDRPLSTLNPIELAVLRIGTYELQFRLDVPYRVVIDESLRLAKTFGSVEGYRYVNGILDKVAKALRQTEMKQEK